MRYLCFDNQIQTLLVNHWEGQEDIMEGAYQDSENQVSDIPYYVKCPWQFRFGIGCKFKLSHVFGIGNDTSLKVYQNHPVSQITNSISNAVRLFYSTPLTAGPGIKRSEHNLLSDGTQGPGQVITHNMLTQMDHSDYSVSYEVDMDIETNKDRIRELDIVDETDFVPDVMHKRRLAFPSKTTYHTSHDTICVKFLPVARTYQSYEGYNDGLHLQFQGEGTKTISKKGSTNNEWLVFCQDTVTTQGVALNRGQPYQLSSPSVTVQDGTNMILHIWQG